MKCLLILALLGSLLLFNLSCRHNRLKTNEKELAEEIILQESKKTQAEIASEEKKIPAAEIKTFGGLRSRENSSIDPQSPPFHIDIAGTEKNTRKIKLSDIASSVRYVKLQTPPDTSLLYDPFFYRDDLISTIRSDGEEIIFQGLFGLIRFNMQGEYLQTLWKNSTGIEIRDKTVMWRHEDFYGVMPNTPVSIIDGNVYYSFIDGPSGTDQVMKYTTRDTKSLSIQSQSEVPGPGTIHGDTLLNTRGDPMKRFDWVFGTGEGTWAGINNEWNAGSSGSLLVTYNENGDTLCQFSDFERIVNFSHTNYRVPAKLINYYYNGLLTIKQEYNDTVFRLIAPDRLLPAFIFTWGRYKVKYIDGLDPGFNLSNKFLLNSLIETKNYLFIRYTQNSDSPANRKNNSVKFYNAFFDKKEGKLYHNPGSTFLPEGIINDIDGGLPFWPDIITPHGELMKLVSGKVLKDYVNSTEFKEADISDENRQKQISMVSGLRNTDMVIMIVK